MKLSKHQSNFTHDISLLISHAETLGINLTFGEAYRTLYQQKEYFRRGLTKTLKSNHLSRLAVDFNFFTSEGKYISNPFYDDRVSLLGEYWVNLRLGNRWGGNFKSIYDPSHFEFDLSTYRSLSIKK